MAHQLTGVNVVNVTLYKQPDGRMQVIDVLNIYPDDQKWFEEKNAKISMEETGGQFVIYADIGLKDEDGEPNELIIIAGDRSCHESFAELRKECEIALAKEPS